MLLNIIGVGVKFTFFMLLNIVGTNERTSVNRRHNTGLRFVSNTDELGVDE